MKTLQIASLSLVLLGSGLASAQEPAEDAQPQAIQPASPQPTMQPPAPQAIPAPPASQQQPEYVEQPQAAAQPADGQWVYTQQNGWLWMPYGQEYMSQTTDTSGAPYEYVYAPDYGWSWLAAPWVMGWGASPYFGVWGPARFGWYRPGYWHGYALRGWGPGYGRGF